MARRSRPLSFEAYGRKGPPVAGGWAPLSGPVCFAIAARVATLEFGIAILTFLLVIWFASHGEATDDNCKEDSYKAGW